MRCGILAQKVGMTRVFTEEGAHVPVTVLKLDDPQVVAHRTAERDGYTAVQLGGGRRKVKHTTKAMRGHFAKARVEPKRRLVEFRVSEDALIEVGAVRRHLPLELHHDDGTLGEHDRVGPALVVGQAILEHCPVARRLRPRVEELPRLALQQRNAFAPGGSLLGRVVADEALERADDPAGGGRVKLRQMGVPARTHGSTLPPRATRASSAYRCRHVQPRGFHAVVRRVGRN